MSFLRKIRRRHKAFVLKRSTQVNDSDKAASASSVDDGDNEDEDEDEDEGKDCIAESLQQTEVQNVHVSTAASPRHEIHHIPSPIEGYSVHKGVPAQSLFYIPTGIVIDEDAGMNFVGKESRFWPRTAKTAGFLLVTGGAFFVGKLAAVGITLTVALACKLFARGRIDTCESVILAGAGKCYHSHQSLLSRSELVRLDSDAELSDEIKIPFVRSLGNVAMDANGHSQMDMEAIGLDQSKDSLSINTNGDTLLAHRKQLKRLGCIKLPPSASPSIEAMDDSPCSSAKASPRMWFHNSGSSMATGKGATASSTEMNRQGKFKSKVFLRHLRKGEPHSAPSSPSRSSQEASHGFCIVCDESDTERPAHPAASVHRNSKFRPASPVAKEFSRADANMISSLQKGEMKQTRETMSPDVCISHFQKGEEKPSAFMPTTPRSKESMAKMDIQASDVCVSHFCKGEEKPSAFTPATLRSRESMGKTDIQAPSAGTYDLLYKRRGHQCTWKHVTPTSQDSIRANGSVSANEDSLQGFVQKQGEKKHQKVRVGTSWIASGLVITISGLFMGRTVAIAGLVCYWYVLSLKSRKASGRRRN